MYLKFVYKYLLNNCTEEVLWTHGRNKQWYISININIQFDLLLPLKNPLNSKISEEVDRSLRF